MLDFSLPELSNLMVGSVADAVADRLTNAGKRGIPQIVAAGWTDIFDLAGWQEVPPADADRPFHAHNRLIKSAGLSAVALARPTLDQCVEVGLDQHRAGRQ